MCQAKLPNAAPGLPDPKKARKMFEDPSKGFPKFLQECIADPQFKDRLLTRILDRAINESASKQVCFRDEIVRILAEELLEEYKRRFGYSKG